MRSCCTFPKRAARKNSLHSSAESKWVFTASKSPHWWQWIEHAKQFADAGGGIGPVIRGFDGNRVRKEIRFPRNLLDFTSDEHQIVEIRAGAARVANHFVGNVHAHDAALGNEFCQPPGKPAGSATDVEDVVGGSELHFFQDRQGDRQVILLHTLAAAGFRPAVEFLTQGFAGLRLRHTPFDRVSQLHHPAAGGAEMCAIRRQSAALRTEPA